MKKTITFLATVAFSCCGISSSFAQIQILGGSPTAAPMLISNQTELGEVNTPVAQEALGNPFDFFATEEASKENFPVSEEASSPSDADPASLPVGRNVRKRTIVDTINDHATVSAVPNAAMAPVFWNQLARTPNPVAEILLRDECNTRELWNGYPAQRAAECEHMWSKIAGRDQNCGCARQTRCTTCKTSTGNRYIRQTQPCGCDQRSAAAPIDDVQQVAVPAVSAKPANESETGKKVAFLKLPWAR